MSISLTCEASERWQDLAAVSQSLQCLAKHPFVGTCLMTSHASIRLISIKEVQVYSVGEGMKRGQRKPSISFNIEFFTHRMGPEKAARFATEFVDLFIVTAPEKAGPRTGLQLGVMHHLLLQDAHTVRTVYRPRRRLPFGARLAMRHQSL